VKLLRWIAIVLGALVGLVAAVAFGARFADGPIAIFPGGAFATGVWVEDPNVDFSFAADIEEIELQSGAPPTSRTTWILLDGEQAFVPCSLGFPPGKRWHTDALTSPEAVVRIEGKRYRRRLLKVEDEALVQRLAAAAEQKYGGGPPSGSGVWFFQLAPPG
jgi:hypothetical protein